MNRIALVFVAFAAAAEKGAKTRKIADLRWVPLLE